MLEVFRRANSPISNISKLITKIEVGAEFREYVNNGNTSGWELDFYTFLRTRSKMMSTEKSKGGKQRIVLKKQSMGFITHFLAIKVNIVYPPLRYCFTNISIHSLTLEEGNL
jgi:hypothetical protein